MSVKEIKVTAAACTSRIHDSSPTIFPLPAHLQPSSRCWLISNLSAAQLPSTLLKAAELPARCILLGRSRERGVWLDHCPGLHTGGKPAVGSVVFVNCKHALYKSWIQCYAAATILTAAYAWQRCLQLPPSEQCLRDGAASACSALASSACTGSM